MSVFFFFSCSENELKIDLTPPDTNETDVSVELATTAAQNFSHFTAFLNNPGESDLKSSQFISSNFKSDRKIKKTLTITCEDELPAFYVVQFEPEGYVIVAASKKESPILAFSETGHFEYNPNIPSGLTHWMEIRKKRIRELRSNPSVEVSNNIKEQWDGVAPPEDEEEIISGGTVEEKVGPLLDPIGWSQGAGFNEYCPDYNCYGYGTPDNGKAWAGCVAVATGQVMKYWEYPNTYAWNLMPDKTGSMETSRLLRDIGDLVNMSYGCDISGAVTAKAKDALVSYGYSSSAVFVDFNTSTLKSQFNLGWPVIMRGAAAPGIGGHAWVCDGYKRNKYIKIHNPGTYYEYETYTYSSLYMSANWGWGPYSGNGFYLYYDFTPGSNNFNFDREMIINIHP